MTSELNISTDKIFLDFKKHFEIEGNEKILFSAKYGTGKSFFLNKFFTEEEIDKNYKVITISPINYSVSNNEDIFELIKADIIRNFFLNDTLKFTKGDNSFDKLTVVKEYLKYSRKHPYKIGKQLIEGLAKVGTLGLSAQTGIDSAFGVIDDFRKFEKELNEKHKTTEDSAEEFSEDIQNKIGSYLEYNFISKLISEVLQKIKTKEKKDNVLVIEDFDRLDPAHIFRILNIFSAHTIDERNKFGFDKVVIVCDLQNIESLYKHLYGNDIDFNGYIDKFYSLHPYSFDNAKAIYFFLSNNFKLPIEDYSLKALAHLLRFFDRDAKTKIRLRKMAKSTIDKLEENPVLVSYNYKEDFDPVFNQIPYLDGRTEVLEIFSRDVQLISIIKFLKNLYGGYDELLKVIDFQQNIDYQMNSEESFNYLRLLSIPAMLCADTSEHFRLFFKSKESFEYPEFYFASGQVRCVTKWNQSNKYLTGSFYEKSTLIYLGRDTYFMNFRSVIEILRRFIQVGLDKEWLN